MRNERTKETVFKRMKELRSKIKFTGIMKEERMKAKRNHFAT